MTRYIVINENTLAYTVENSYMVGVLAGSVRDGGRNPLNGPIFISPLDMVRDANSEDFSHYRIHLSERVKEILDKGSQEAIPTTDDFPTTVNRQG